MSHYDPLVLDYEEQIKNAKTLDDLRAIRDNWKTSVLTDEQKYVLGNKLRARWMEIQYSSRMRIT